MLLSDVVKVLGDQPLSEFPWGCVVKDTVNLFTPNDLKLTLTSTGADLSRALDAMSETNRTLLHSAQLDASRSCVITPVGGGLVVEHGNQEVPEAPLLTRVNLITGFIVVNVLLICFQMFSSLTINEDTDWSKVQEIGWSVLKTLGGEAFGKLLE